MVPPDESILAVQAVPAGNRGQGPAFDANGTAPKQARQLANRYRPASPREAASPEGSTPPELAGVAPHGTKVAIEKDTESGKLVMRVKDAVTGDVIKQLPPEEMLRIARSIEKYLGLLVDKRS